MKELYTLDEQLELEKKYKILAQEKYSSFLNDQREKGRLANTPMAKGVIKVMIDAFSTNVRNVFDKTVSPSTRGVRKNYYNLLMYLRQHMSDEKILLTLCTHTFDTIFGNVLANRSESMTVSSLAFAIVDNAYTDLKSDIFLKRYPDIKNTMEDSLDKRVKMYKKVGYLQGLYKKYDVDFYEPTRQEVGSLGITLINLFVESSNLFEFQNYGGKASRVVPTQDLINLWRQGEYKAIQLATNYTPTIIKPKPWTSYDSGAYYGELSSKVKMIRLPQYMSQTRTQRRYKELLKELDLSYIQQALTKIANTKFRINRNMLEVIRTLIEQGGDTAGIAKIEPYEEIGELKGEYTPEELKAHKKKIVDRIYREIKRKSKALRALNTFGMARDFAKYDEIYFPVNMDFRGRIYPIPTFNYQGEDLAKALIEFAEPVPCKSESDLDLLKIQGCNLSGNDKISLDDRVAWVDKHEDLILSCADDCFNCNWWKDMDEPLQFLAFCIEYKRAKEYISNHGTIIGYKCHIQIAFDGTCSGLQHYSAMLRDSSGGSAVNLVDHEVPADIYNEVARLVKIKAEHDAVNGTPDGTTINGKPTVGTRNAALTWVTYGITRKVCKRPVMTLAYGSTLRGFENQIEEDTTRDDIHFKGVERACARWLARAIWEAVDEVIVSATKGMDYLKEIARKVAKADYPVTWWTPIGLPIQQFYIKSTGHSFRTRLGSKVSMPLYYRKLDENEKSNVNKQVQGVAPNFIHSLDATHLMMTVNEANLSNYAVVHDSFATSLGEASKLQVVIREQFYKLYTEYKPLEMFKAHAEEQLRETFENIEPPPKGDLDLTEVLTSKYIFH